MAVSRILMSDKPVTKISRFSANICKLSTPCFISFFTDFYLPSLTHFSFRQGDFLPAICNKTNLAFLLLVGSIEVSFISASVTGHQVDECFFYQGISTYRVELIRIYSKEGIRIV